MKMDGTFATNYSGSMAGLTASRNKGGMYLRERISPVQPNTVAQAQAKARFGASASIWGTLLAGEKSLWRQFASTIFSPRSATNNGQFSGFQAFQSLSTSFDSSIANNRTFDLTVDGIAPPSGQVSGPYNPPIGTPPSLASSPNWQTVGGIDMPLILTDASLDIAGNFDATLQVGNGGGFTMTNFLNPNNASWGMAFFLSNGNAQVNQSYANPINNLIAYIEPTGVIDAADLVNVSEINYATNDLFDISRFQKFPNFGNSVLVTAFMVTNEMQMNKVGVLEIQVT